MRQSTNQPAPHSHSPQSARTARVKLARRLKLAISGALLLAAISQAQTGAQEPYVQEPWQDARLAQLLTVQSLRYPAPQGCATVGVWEDGSIVAVCPDSPEHAWLAHGPDADDSWTAYTGPVADSWADRAQTLDGQTGS